MFESRQFSSSSLRFLLYFAKLHVWRVWSLVTVLHLILAVEIVSLSFTISCCLYDFLTLELLLACLERWLSDIITQAIFLILACLCFGASEPGLSFSRWSHVAASHSTQPTSLMNDSLCLTSQTHNLEIYKICASPQVHSEIRG
ncbi:hypothetical protein BDW74DRAFT_2653 [Aspergillus multicolor]|uniref:uncharacterized protein n=1 Tax=Aspergillus multicolor TaxID=41759 RepID=UPI003CCDFE68